MRSIWTKGLIAVAATALAAVPIFARRSDDVTARVEKTESLPGPELIQGQVLPPGDYTFIIEGNTMTVLDADSPSDRVVAQVTGQWTPQDMKPDNLVFFKTDDQGIQSILFDGQRGVFVVNPAGPTAAPTAGQ
jgi:hypothetical protein